MDIVKQFLSAERLVIEPDGEEDPCPGSQRIFGWMTPGCFEDFKVDAVKNFSDGDLELHLLEAVGVQVLECVGEDFEVFF